MSYQSRHAASIAPAYAGPRRPQMPLGLRYALILPHPAGWFPKPVAFATISELARSIHRRRGEDALNLVDSELITHGRPDPIVGITVWATDPDSGDVRRYLGFAWCNGAGREVLQFALGLERRGIGA